MDANQAQQIITHHLRETFGQILRLKPAVLVRRASGRTWSCLAYCEIPSDEILVGTVTVHEDGYVMETLSVEDLVQAIRQKRAPTSLIPVSATEDLFADLDMPASLHGTQVTLRADSEPPSPVGELALRTQIQMLKSSGQDNDLRLARNLLPQLLADVEGRRFTLVELGEVELKLGNLELALQYLEAAAREFADRSELRALELVSGIALRVLGEKSFAESRIKQLLEYSRRRIRPIEHLGQASVFAGLDQDNIEAIDSLAERLSFQKGDVLMKEGDLALRVYVVQSGILSIRLAQSDGALRTVRCSYPGDLVGESSVLGRPGATCTATVEAECLTTCWSFDGDRLRLLSELLPALATRLQGARALHQLDSYFSMNETTQTLDARMRDRILSCVTGLRRARAGESLTTAGEVPSSVYLVSEGSVAVNVDGSCQRVVGPDGWIGLRDALHALPSESECVASTLSVLIVFDAERLRSFSAEASADVVAVFERLG